MNQVLILSSDPVLKQKNIDVLVNSGFRVSDASDCLEGLLMVDRNGFDVIIIDEELLDFDGYRASQKIRQYSEIPIVLLGTEPDEEVWAKVEDLGFDIYLKKPVSPRELMARVKALLRRAYPEPEKPVEREEPAEIQPEPVTPLQEIEPVQLEQAVEPEKPVEREEPAEIQPTPVTPLQEIEPVQLEEAVEPEKPVEREQPPEIQPTPVTPPQEIEPVRLEQAVEPEKPVEREEPAEIQQLKVNCPDCGSENPAGQRFCGTCGTKLAVEVQPLKVNCPDCGLENPAGQRFCGTCGAKLAAEMQPAPVTPLQEIEPVRLEQAVEPEKPVEREQPAEVQPTSVIPLQETEHIRLEQAVEPEKPAEVQPAPVIPLQEVAHIRSEQAVEPEKPVEREQPPQVQPEPVSPRELMSRVKSLLKRPSPDKETKPLEREQPAEVQQLKVNCHDCGSENPAGQRFCGTCGVKLTAEMQPAPVTPLQEIEPVRLEQAVEPEKPVEREQPAEVQPTSVIPLQETGPVRSEQAAESEAALAPVAAEEPPAVGTAFETWQDARVAKLIDALVSNKLTEIHPVIDISLKGGFAYPEVDRILETSGEETMHILEALAGDDILNRKPFEKLHVDPEGSFQLVPVERCPHCGSGNLYQGQLIEHFNCGNVGLELDYKSDFKYICPKCKRELRLLGTDYRHAGMQYKCLDCNEIFATPVTKWRSLKTGKVWSVDELREVWLYSYSLNADKRDWLEFQLKPKAQLVDFLRLQGYQVEELAEIAGRSGAVHTVDILATRDDGLAKFYLGVGILTALPGEAEVRLEELFKFDTRAYDMGIQYKVVIAIPKLNPEAIKFAERQKIGVFEASDLDTLVSFLSSRSRPSPAVITRAKARYLGETGTAAGPQEQLAGFLQHRGYEVFEKAKVPGKSGAEHTFDIFAQRDDGIVRPTIAVAIVTADGEQAVGIDKVSQFDAEAYDAGIRNKVLVGIPQISPQAKQFAQQQRIKVLDEYELEGLIRSWATV